MHMFLGAIRAGTSLSGFIDKGLVEVHNILARHNQLAKEMSHRGWKHKSLLAPSVQNLLWIAGSVDVESNILELQRRCPACRRRIKELQHHHV